MLVSLLHKSKSLLGIGRQAENDCNKTDVVEESLDAAVWQNAKDKNVIAVDENDLKQNEELKFIVYDLIRTIQDPEKPSTLEDLNVVYDEGVFVRRSPDAVYLVQIEFNPTVPHCTLATLIGLCIRIKLERHLMENFKLDILIKKGAHSTEEEINKQINDKERIAAAMENPSLRELVEKCIKDQN